MKRITPAILIALAVSMTAGRAGAAAQANDFEQRCERELTPRVEASARDHGYRVDNTVSSRVLVVRSRHHYAGDLMMGMTARRAHANIDIAGSALIDAASRRECIAPRVAVEVMIPQLDVFVAREFAPVSCPFRRVLAHEMRHVQLYREHLPKIASRVQAALEVRYAGRPFYAARGEGLNALETELNAWLRTMIQSEFDDLEKLQVALDTREESYSLSLSCNGALGDTLGYRE